MIEIKFTGENAADVLAQIAQLTAGKLTHETKTAASPNVPTAQAPGPVQAPVMNAPSMTAPVAQAPVVPTTAAPSITLEQLGKAGADLIAANPGMMQPLTALLQQFGVPSVQELRPDQIGAFATAMRGLGAKI